jgi:hypothetical protein
MRLFPLVLVLALALGGRNAAALDRPHVYLVIVDGLDDRFVTPESFPVVLGAVRGDAAHASAIRGAFAVMPTRTDPNHASLLTGVWSDGHGITGNAYWTRELGAPPRKMDDPSLLDVETLFTVIETDRPTLVTMGIFGKPKLARLFAAVPERQQAPDVLWSGEDAAERDRDPATRYATDDAAMRTLLERAAATEPDLAVVNLADVDRAAHGFGPASAEAHAAVRATDGVIGRLLDDLRARGRWDHSVVIVTADHGFDAVGPTAENPSPEIALAPALERAGVQGIVAVADGGIDHLYATLVKANDTAVGGAASLLARASTVARAMPGVVEVLARLPVPGVALLSEVHPDWHLQHQRAGELIVVAAQGHQFVDGADPKETRLLGNHGGPGERRIPLFVLGGWGGLSAAPPTTRAPSSVDVAATTAVLLGLRAPRRLDGRPIRSDQLGRPIAAVLTDRIAGSIR